MYKSLKSIKLTDNMAINTMVLAVVSVVFKLMTSERGTYNYLVHDSAVFELLSDYFNIDPIHKKMFLVGLDWDKYLDSMLLDIEEKSKSKNHLVSIDGILYVLDSKLVIKVFSSMIAERLSNDLDFLNRLDIDKTRIDKYRIQCVDEFYKNGEKYINVLLCRSFDDGKKIYTYKKVLWENDDFYYVDGYPMVYKV